MLAIDLIDRRTMWRDYWIEWGLAALFLGIDEWLQWRVAALGGARVPVVAIVPPLLISICVFPLSAWIVSRFDRWRLGR
jgi:rod shape-determining protein MreD